MKNQKEKTSSPGGHVYPAIIDGEKVETSMQRRAGNQVQQETVASEIASETSQEAAYTRVDQYTLEIIQQIFPAPNKGLEFTAGILHYAQIMQNVLPGLEDMGEHVAVINVRTIRTLAQLINWGYDTTHKYVTTFCALGLLRKIKQGAERLLVFPLERYVLPINLQSLDSLITKSRPKVQQFARQVKARLLQLNPVALTQSGNMEMDKFEGHNVSSENALYQSLFSLMESEGIDSATSRHLSKRIITEVLSQFDTAMLTIQTHERTYAQAATGTLNSGRGSSSFTAPSESSHLQVRSSRYQPESTSHPTKYPQYEVEATDRQPESTGYPTKYPRYEIEATDRQPESTGYPTKYPRYEVEATDRGSESTGYTTKYPRHQVESTSESSQGRLSSMKVSARGRLTDRETSSPPVEETPAFRSRQSRVSPSKGHAQAYQERASQPEAQFYYTIEEVFSHIMTTWDMLTSYEYILKEKLIDWEADGLPTELIEKLYAEIYTVNTEYAERGMAVASHKFFLSVLEKRAIERLATEYRLDFTHTYNLILFRTNRERFMIAEQPKRPPAKEVQPPEHDRYSQHKGQYHTNYTYDDQQPEYNEPAKATYTNEYQSPVDPRANEYQSPVDPRANEYQGLVDPEQDRSTHQQPQVDFRNREYHSPVDSSQQESTSPTQASADELDAQESTPSQIPLAELIDRAALADGLTRLRIPRALNKQNYTSDFLNVYVTYNINKLFKKLLDDVTLRNDGKMFFAEIFDTARAGAAKNWYNKLFTKCSSPESLLAGFIETIIDMHSRGNATIQNPGGLFNKKIAECEKFISDSTHEHIKVYGELCYEDFVLEIARLASRESLGMR